MSRNVRIILIGTVLLAVVAGVIVWWQSRARAEDRPLVLYGNVDVREVDMAFRQPGRIVSMAFDEGATVKAGDVLAVLDSKPYEDQVAAARADVARAKAELEKLKRGNRAQEIAQAAANVRQAEAAVAQADADFVRQSSLVDIGGSSQKAVDAARGNRDRSRAELASARQGLSLRREGSRREDIAAGEAAVSAAEAALAQAETALADTRLASPANAVVTTRVREPGSMVGVNAPVFTLSLRDPVYVRAYVSEPHLPKVAPGTAVTVRVDGSEQAFSGTVGFVSPRAEFTPKSVETADLRTDLVYRLRIVVPGPAPALRQGAPVTVLLEADRRDGKKADKVRS